MSVIVTTKGRYALRVMLDLAEQNAGDYIVLKDIAARQEISEKYLEGILATLSKGGLVVALRGRGGGYKLAKAPENYTVGSILKLVEGSLSPITCLESKENTCQRAGQCHTLPMWEKLDRLIDDFFEGITLAELLQTDNMSDYYVI